MLRCLHNTQCLKITELSFYKCGKVIVAHILKLFVIGMYLLKGRCDWKRTFVVYIAQSTVHFCMNYGTNVVCFVGLPGMSDLKLSRILRKPTTKASHILMSSISAEC